MATLAGHVARIHQIEAEGTNARGVMDHQFDSGAAFAKNSDFSVQLSAELRGHLGIESFGANAFEAHAGELLVVPHDESGEGEQQEELYVVVAGRARFVCDGEEIVLAPGGFLYARPGVHREAVALATPTLLLIHPIGGTVFCYRDLVDRLAVDAPVYGIQAAGLLAGESLPGSIEEVAEHYLQAVAAVVTDASFV